VRALGLAFALLLTAGCFGGSTTSSRPPATTPEGGCEVTWSIRYGVGYPQPHRFDLPDCPTGAHCRIFRDRHETYVSGAHPWAEVATRSVVCGPGALAGDACGAIARLRAVLAKPERTVCSCPMIATVRGRAVATINGRKVVVPLDFCTYCGRSTKQTSSDLALLQPQT
jgi:hypothetical protein